MYMVQREIILKVLVLIKFNFNIGVIVMNDVTKHYDNGISVKGYREREKAFLNAIKKGLKDIKYYMYMYTKNNKDYFKNKLDRKYISFNE